jgi:hypothetical protein
MRNMRSLSPEIPAKRPAPPSRVSRPTQPAGWPPAHVQRA